MAGASSFLLRLSAPGSFVLGFKVSYRGQRLSQRPRRLLYAKR